jgi:uncharacterized protein (DUF4415 family)
MPKQRHKPDHISQEDWDSVDSPPLSSDFIAGMRPVRESNPALFEAHQALRRGRGPQKAPTKKLVSLRIDQDVLEHFKATGEGWQSRLNEALRKAMKTSAEAG